MWIDLLLVIVGIGLLTLGGEVLISGALGLARRMQISSLLTGLVVVGFGTSMPELVVSVDAALIDQPGIALGNVVGSNIGNVLLILGLCAVVRPLPVTPLGLSRDAVSGVAASGLFIVLAAGGALGRIDGLILLAGLAAYLAWAYRSEKRLEAAGAREVDPDAVPGSADHSALYIALTIAGGLLLLIAGSRVLLIGAVALARDLGVSEAVIGLTLVAVGTSLPELTVSLLAVLRRHVDVAVGNILGSNLFNLLGILGVSSLLQTLPLPRRMAVFDQWMLLAASLAALILLWSGRRLSRAEGVLFLLAYAVYLILGFRVFPS
ncbi:calcium/sodium antiporter [Wenzhouxiangella sediminis]|uniref:Sodium:calcium antiporter n=1 Tax=Wenzhouxiangella sediminis TaxID=1792836 RepID=A0A3E1KAX5_9GAMM|nr:calcium/sodium antiporter [Wenzhouxiangella sediminis]RFF31385.1 sodium:calcium antiporter [Wenzhouxiangella sediminis]